MESMNENGIQGDHEAAKAELMRGDGHLWNIILSYVNSMALKCAAELGIADEIYRHGQPLPLSLLLTKLSILPSRTDSFRRLMRLLVHSGLFARSTAGDQEEETYALTPISATFLVTSKAENMTPFVLAVLDPVCLDPWQCLSTWFTAADEPPAAFDHFHGKSLLFELTGNNPELNVNFNRGMAGDANFVAKLILEQCGNDVFGGLRSLVDVGGGSGTLATAIAGAFPQTKCAVFDLPHVVTSLQGNPMVAAIAGDMFEFVPPADAVILKWVLDSWNDEGCVRILRNCKKAIPPKEEGGKVIIIEMVMNLENEEDGSSIHDESTETQLLWDVQMMVPAPGKERNEAEWKSIFLAAGFSGYTITPILGCLRSLIQLFY